MRVFRGASRNLPAVRPICFQISERVRSPSPPRGPRNHSTIAGEAPGGPAAQHRRGTGAGPGHRRGGGAGGRRGGRGPPPPQGWGGAMAAAQRPRRERKPPEKTLESLQYAGEDAQVRQVRGAGGAGGGPAARPPDPVPSSPKARPPRLPNPLPPPLRSPGRPRGVVVATGRPAGLRRGLDRVRGSRSSAGVHPSRLSTFLVLLSPTPHSLRPARAPGADAERARPVLPPPRRRCGCPCSR